MSKQLTINGKPAGEVTFYEQDRQRGGWVFHLAQGPALFLPFAQIKRFASCPALDITTF